MKINEKKVKIVVTQIKNLLTNNEFSVEEMRAVVGGLLDHVNKVQTKETAKTYKEKMN